MIPLGYKVVDGKVVVDEAGADQVRELFESYLAGVSLRTLGEKIQRSHTSITRILSNRQYLGDEIFPAIIDEDLFQRVADERARLQREGHKKVESSEPDRLRFSAPKPKQIFEDPFKQAEYAYSLINLEEETD